MIDAYTVGITLALDNGVSTGIATIRRDLSALDKAIDRGATGLNRLQQAAGGLRIRPRVQDPESWPALPPSGAAQRDIKSPVNPEQEYNPTATFATRQQLLLDHQERRPAVVDLAAPPQVESVMNGVHHHPAQSAPTPAISLKQHSDSGLSAWLGTSSRPIQPSAPNQHTQFEPAVPDIAYGDSRTLGTNAALPTASQSPYALLRANESSTYNDAERATSVRSDIPFNPSPISVAPRAAQTSIGPSEHSAPTYASVAGSDLSVVPPPTPPQNGPMQGDVYLDGTRLGRWISERLTRAAEQPRSGITGFDPRLSITWPGAPIGA
jgi:hypothetical protein